MQPNVIVAEAIGHRARFAWLGAALAATVALLVASAVRSDPQPPKREVVQQRYHKAEWRPHGCFPARKRVEASAEEVHARAEAIRAAARARAEARARIKAARAKGE